jgi:hypothetical protein
MWERFNKVAIANVIALVVVGVSSFIALTTNDKSQQDKFMDMGFGAVIGWAYMRSQGGNKTNQL